MSLTIASGINASLPGTTSQPAAPNTGGFTFGSFLGKTSGGTTSSLNTRFTSDRIVASYDALQLRMDAVAPEHAQTLTDNRDAYLAIFAKAKAANGLTNPLGFVKSLSTKELEVLQKTHSLADPIQTEALSAEGALNLILPVNESLDINKDGINEVGIAKMGVFPPHDAPQAVLDAWANATTGMDAGTVMHMSFSMQMQARGLKASETADMPYFDESFSWQNLINRTIESAEFNRKYEATDVQHAFGAKLRAGYQALKQAFERNNLS